MSKETFSPRYYDTVLKALKGAKGITWDGCHKIYILADDESVENSESWGYVVTPVENTLTALDKLYEWFDHSCCLRFIHKITGCQFTSIVGQLD